MKRCSSCGEEKEVAHFWRDGSRRDGLQASCKDCSRQRTQSWRARNPDTVRANRQAWLERNPDKARDIRQRGRGKRLARQRDADRRRLYGLEPEDYDNLLRAQGSRCAICHTDNPGPNRRSFSVDHCHATGRVRGLLCNRCNVTLGHFQDSPALLASAINYLEKHNADNAA